MLMGKGGRIMALGGEEEEEEGGEKRGGPERNLKSFK